MITLDEKRLWNTDQEEIADLLANKSWDDVYDILEDYNCILVKQSPEEVSPLQRICRIFTIPLIPVLFLLSGVKWVFTGDRYLDSWFKKIGFREWAKKWMF